MVHARAEKRQVVRWGLAAGAAVVLLALLLAACGGDDAADDPAEPAAKTPSTPLIEPEPEPDSSLPTELADIATRIEDAGFAVKEAKASDADAALLVEGDIDVFLWPNEKEADDYLKVLEGLPPDRARFESDGTVTYFLGQEQALTQAEIADFEAVVAAGSKSGSASGEGQQPAASAAAQEFSGNGSQLVAIELVVEEPSVLRWTNDDKPLTRLFMLQTELAEDPRIHVNSEAESGETQVEPGTYSNLEVRFAADWTVTIEPLD